MTILDENHHSFLIVEHDPMLYEDAENMVEYVAQHMRQTSREATVLLYAPALDPHLEKMTELADRVFCFLRCQKLLQRDGQELNLCQEPRLRWRHTHDAPLETKGSRH